MFNAHRQANNAATNENKPLIGQSVIDEVKDPRIQKLIFNPYNNKTRSLRGAAQQDGTVRNRLRMSMGGSDQSFNSDRYLLVTVQLFLMLPQVTEYHHLFLLD